MMMALPVTIHNALTPYVLLRRCIGPGVLSRALLNFSIAVRDSAMNLNFLCSDADSVARD